MANLERNRSWKQLFQEHGSKFFDWLETNSIRLKKFNELSENLDNYLFNFVLCNKSYSGEREVCDLFASNLPRVLKECDNPDIYNEPLVADAYAYIHLLDRYRRFWDVLVEITRGNILPMRDRGIDVLDIGTGPAPVLYAVSDFYNALNDYAIQHCTSLKTPLPQLDCVESSSAMIRVACIISELSLRKNGPYDTIFKVSDGSNLSFDDLNLSNERIVLRDGFIRQLADEDGMSERGARRWAHEQEPFWKDRFRYNLIIFSNFLTQPERVYSWKEELRITFKNLRVGGVIIVVGATEGRYPKIYKMVEELAHQAGIKRMNQIRETIPCDYTNEYALRIKESYNRIWRRLEECAKNLKEVKGHLSRDVWSSDVPLTGPKQFSLRVFRKGKL